MANIIQKYSTGVLFNAYSSAEIQAKATELQILEDWHWHNRSLSGFKKEDGTFVPFSGEVVFDSDYARMSGVWTLNKSSHALSVFGLGKTGQISVDITEMNRELPLADYEHPFTRTQKFVLDSSSFSAVVGNIYFQDYNGSLSITVSCSPQTSLKSVRCGQSWENDFAPGGCSMSCLVWDYAGTSAYLDGRPFAANGQVWANGISVDFVEGGTLTYHGNKVRKPIPAPDVPYTTFKLGDGSVETYDIEGALEYSWFINNGFVTGRPDYDLEEYPYAQWNKNIREIIVGNHVTEICPDGGIAGAFEDSEASVIILPDSISAIGEYAFCDCENLISIAIPSSVSHIRDHMFEACYKLSNVVIPEGINGVGEHVFSECSSLLSITLPSSVNNIYDSAFSSAIESFTYVTDITFTGKTKQQVKDLVNYPWSLSNVLLIGNDPEHDGDGSCTLHCDDGDIIIQRRNIHET